MIQQNVYNTAWWKITNTTESIFNMFLAIASMLGTSILRFSWSHLLHYFLVIFVLNHFNFFFTDKVETKIYERYNYPV